MIVIKPNTGLTILSSSIAESDAVDGTVWSSSATYTKGARVRYEHSTYESAKDANKNKQPDLNTSGDSAFWLNVGGTMPWRILDGIIESKTVGPAGQPLTFSVPYHRATSFALLEVQGISATVTISDDDEGVFFTQTYSLLEDISSTSPWAYMWEDVKSEVVVTGTGMAFDGTITVSIDAGTGEPSIGEFVVGKEVYLGSTQYGAGVSIADYSKKTTDDFGHTSIVRRSFAKRGDFTLFTAPEQADYVHSVLAELRSTVCVWIADSKTQQYDSLVIYGWYSDYKQAFEGPRKNEIDLSIEGVV